MAGGSALRCALAWCFAMFFAATPQTVHFGQSVGVSSLRMLLRKRPPRIQQGPVPSGLPVLHIPHFNTELFVPDWVPALTDLYVPEGVPMLGGDLPRIIPVPSHLKQRGFTPTQVQGFLLMAVLLACGTIGDRAIMARFRAADQSPTQCVDQLALVVVQLRQVVHLPTSSCTTRTCDLGYANKSCASTRLQRSLPEDACRPRDLHGRVGAGDSLRRCHALRFGVRLTTH